ncbi:MAG: ABC transporter substrate-binding protein, partial [Longimicrobiales bacterium]
MVKRFLRTGIRGGLFAGAALGAVLGTTLVSGCGSSPDEGPPDVLIVQQSSVSIGDPHIASDSSDRLAILFSVYEALVRLDPDGNLQPALAVDWEVDPDGRSWTFQLREGVRFHNGDMMTADDVVATLGRILDPSIGGAFGTQGVYISYLGTAEISMGAPVTAVLVSTFLNLSISVPDINPNSPMSDVLASFFNTEIEK